MEHLRTWRRRPLGVAAALVIAAGLIVAVSAGPSQATTTPADVTQSLSFTAPDGTVLHATVAGTGSLAARPLIVEDSPYAPDVTSLDWVGSAFNRVELQWRGTGDSGGSLDATGPKDQSDLSAFLGWACHQSWSSGSIGLWGFSASAIVAYNAMHLPMPCVKVAALGAGSTDLYRDLLDIGGIPNLVPAAAVELSIGGDTLADGLGRLTGDPLSIPAAALGYVTTAADVLGNPTEDSYWRQRTFQGDAGHFPILAGTSFYDVEPSGPFAAYQATRAYGSHLLVMGAHDGYPAGTPGPQPQYVNWFDHYLLGQPLSAANQPPVSLYLSNGSREAFLAGDVTHLTGDDWPLPGTAWTRLYLSSATSGSVASINDGSLSPSPQQAGATATYPFLPSEATETDLHTIAVVGPDGLDQLAGVLPGLTTMSLSGPTSLTWTTPPLSQAADVVGPGDLQVAVSSTDPVTDLYAVVADVQPDGTAYPVATGELRTAYPDVERSRSEVDAAGDVVQPYPDFSTMSPATPLTTRTYDVGLMPVGNHFAAGDRLRLYLVGTPFTQLPSPPGINTVSLGGATPSRLVLPTSGGGFAFGGPDRR